MSWGRTPNKALKSYDIPTDFGQWSILAADRWAWQQSIGVRPPCPSPAATMMPNGASFSKAPHSAYISTFNTILFEKKKEKKKKKRARRLGGGETASLPTGERCILSAIEVVSASRSMAYLTGRSRVFISFYVPCNHARLKDRC